MDKRKKVRQNIFTNDDFGFAILVICQCVSQNMSHLTYTNPFLNEVYPVEMKFDGSVMLLDGIVFKNGWHESKITAK